MSQHHPGSRRVHQSSSNEPDDVFIARVLHLGNWAEAHQQALVVLAVVLAIVVYGLYSYGNARVRMQQQAARPQIIAIRVTDARRRVRSRMPRTRCSRDV